MSLLRRLLGEPAPGAPAAPLPYDPTSPKGLAARWVQWAAAEGPGSNPISDDTGQHGGLNQPDDVWFLAGTFGGDVERQVAVTAGVPLFFPAVNYWVTYPEGPAEPPEGAFGEVWVDGEPQSVTDIATELPFEVSGVRLNPVTRRSKPVPTTVWGLWAHLPALEPGGHTVFFRGGLQTGFTISAKYLLTVD